MKTAELLMQENFYAGSSTWKVVSDENAVCLKPIFNRKIIIIQSVTVFILSILSYYTIVLLSRYEVLNLTDNIQSKLFSFIPWWMLIFGFIAITVIQFMEYRDVRRGPTFIYDKQKNIIQLPHKHCEIIPDSSTHLQYIHYSRGNSIYELNLVHNSKRFPLLRALNPFVIKIGEEVAGETSLKLEIYHSTGKRPFEQVATGGYS